MKLARTTGVRVLLDGQGGDELFCGYPGFFPPWIAQLIRDGRWPHALHLLRSPLVRCHFGRRSLTQHVVLHLLPESTRRQMRVQLRPLRFRAINEDLLEHAHESNSRSRPGAVAASQPPLTSPFDRFWWDMLRRKSLPSLLHFEDRSSMAFSIEARVPF